VNGTFLQAAPFVQDFRADLVRDNRQLKDSLKIVRLSLLGCGRRKRKLIEVDQKHFDEAIHDNTIR